MSKPLTCGTQQTVANSERDGNPRPPDLPPEQPICRSGSNTENWTWNLYVEYIMRNAGLEEAQAGIKISGRNINHLRYADDTTCMAECAELKSLLMKVKEERKKLA